MKHLVYGIFTIFLFGCATTIPNFDEYQKAPLLNAEFMPERNELERKTPVVLLLDFEVNKESEKGLGSITRDYFSALLLQNKLAILQDRKLIGALKDEITLASIAGKNFELKAVDYAIGGQISNVAFSSSFFKESAHYQNQQTSSKEKLLHQPEEYYQYTASVSGSVVIYEVPSLKIIDTINFRGVAKQTEKVQTSGIGAFSTRAKPKTYDDSLVKAALLNALSGAAPRVKSFFAKSGYILEKRTLNGNDIFMISLGTEDGVKQEDKVVIMQKRSDFNLLSHREEVSLETLTRGTVADKNSAKRAWIVVKDKEKAAGIRLGDIVKIIY